MKKARVQRLVANSATSSVVGKADEDLLSLIVWAGFLTVTMMLRITPRSRRRAQRRVRVLFDHGLVRAHLQGEALHREQVYIVTQKGIEYLVEHGLLEDGRLRPTRLPRLARLPHALFVRSIFTEFVVAEREAVLDRVDVRFDEELAADPLYQTARLVPDAVLGLSRAGITVQLGVEADRGTETLSTVRGKLRRWANLLSVGAQTPGSLPTALLIVVLGDRRRMTIERVAAELLPHEAFRVVRLEGVVPLLRTPWPRLPAVEGGRANTPQVSVFRAVETVSATTFRALPKETEREP